MSDRNPRSLAGPLIHCSKAIEAAVGEQAKAQTTSGKVRWLGELVQQGDKDGTLEEVTAKLLPAVTKGGWIQPQRADAIIESAWSKAFVDGAPQQLPQLRQVQASIAATNTPDEVQHWRGVALALLGDPLVRNRLSAILLDALAVHDLAGSGPKDGAA